MKPEKRHVTLREGLATAGTVSTLKLATVTAVWARLPAPLVSSCAVSVVRAACPVRRRAGSGRW